MYQLFYQPESVWVGDIMPYAQDGVFYIYHQRDTRNPEPFGEPFGWSLAVTEDFVHYEDFGESLTRGTDEEADQFVYAGSIFRAGEEYQAFYTGFNREYLKEGKTSQMLLHASSRDRIHWKKSRTALQLMPEDGYDKRNWRDPYVVWDAEREEYLLILGARKGEDKSMQTGRLVWFTSKDLKNWVFQGDFWSPGLYTMFEMPELMQMGEWWYLIYSEYSDCNRVHYRMSKNLHGPWHAPKDDGFDGRAYYAARTACDGRRRVLFGWVPTRIQDDDRNAYLWGGTFVPHEIVQNKDGTLSVKPPDSLWRAFQCWNHFFCLNMKTIDTKEETVIPACMGEVTGFEATCSFAEGTRAFSLKFYENTQKGTAYEYEFRIGENRIVFQKIPNYPWYQCFNLGLERPIELNPKEQYQIRFIVDHDIAVLYVNGIALSSRICSRPGNFISFTVTDGELKAEHIRMSTKVQ